MGNLNFFKTQEDIEKDDVIEIGNQTYSIDMSLINVLKFIYLSSDKKIPIQSKLSSGLFLLLKNDLSNLPLDVRVKTYGELMKYLGGEQKVSYDLKGNPIPTPYEEEITDIIQDFDYIYAGFIQTYGIDLYEHRKMDWRRFKALLQSLPKNTKYREVLSIRQLDESQYKGKDRQAVIKAKQAYELEKGG